jgi:hypothetical protein
MTTTGSGRIRGQSRWRRGGAALPVGGLLVVLENGGSGAVLRFWQFHDSSDNAGALPPQRVDYLRAAQGAAGATLPVAKPAGAAGLAFGAGALVAGCNP